MLETQYHHYIPRFILKTFSNDFIPDTKNTVFVASPSTVFDASTLPKALLNGSGSNGTGSNNNIKNKNGYKKDQATKRKSYEINVYQADERTTTLKDIARVYGVENMYREVNEADCMKFEKLLAKMESTSSSFIHRILNNGDLSLTRAQLKDLKKFLFISTLRAEHRRSQYYNYQFDPATLFTIERHRKNKGIAKLQDVWFDNLKWIIETPWEEIISEGKKVIPETSVGLFNYFNRLNEYVGPIHAIELADFIDLALCYVCIWEAEEGSEFVMADNCFDSLRPNPETIYVKGSVSTENDFTPEDVFKYKGVIASKREVQLVNGIILDTPFKHLTYRSSACMYKSLKFYDKVKKEYFHDCRDYTDFKRQLIADMNRTHSF
ncbi:hypothetical protein BGW42_000392 [Actinomortierella wolfii]|nr:hypothetical protein BGW42_000392 [Actinomortierella wolfii]